MKKLVALLLVAALIMAGCGSSPSSEPSDSSELSGQPAETESTADEAEDGNNSDAVVSIAMASSWESLCPLASTSNYGDVACNTIFENLVEVDGKGGYVGRLCESYEVEDNNTTLILHLQQNAVWHDGVPFTADDVMFSTRLYTDGSYTSSRRMFFTLVEGCDDSGIELSEDSAGIEKIDDYTVKIHYKAPTSIIGMFEQAEYFFILPEHLLKDVDPANILEDDFWVNPVGTGPFTFVNQVYGESLTVAAFDDYYLGRPQFGTLVMKVVSEENLITSMMAGEIDIIPGTLAAIADQDLDAARGIDGYTVGCLQGTSDLFMVINSDTFTTPKIRKAMAMMMDKDTMIQTACRGNAVELYSMYSNTSLWYDQGVVDELGYSYDPDAAYDMLVEEGFDFDRTYVACIRDDAQREAIMTVYQATLAQYGIKLEIRTLDTQTCISEMRDGNCDMWINGGVSANPAKINTSMINHSNLIF